MKAGTPIWPMPPSRGGPLYPQGPDPWALMVNNYPPLVFLSSSARLAASPAIPSWRDGWFPWWLFLPLPAASLVILREMGADVLAALFGSLFFATRPSGRQRLCGDGRPPASRPRPAIGGLSLLLQTRRETIAAALADGGGLFIKHNLLALPLAAALWLLPGRIAARRCALSSAAWSSVLRDWCLPGMLLGVNLIAALASPRLWQAKISSPAADNFCAGAARPWRCRGGCWPGARPATRRCSWWRCYAGTSAGTGRRVRLWRWRGCQHIFSMRPSRLAFAAGLALIAYSPALDRTGWRVFRGAAAGACIWRRTSPQCEFPFSEAFAREAPLDIGFPARCIPDRPCART